ncbi:hypothetical protein BKA62DRAFT_700356 [Auriculariales sp. MPI-PUGE-AT-0066]|nr:hypothetical protein BKA62DRAFT_700356 [Auriculariales sp. MPI-PUGE-AT-0066]
MSDARFARLKTDPRFRRPKKVQNKVVVDDRFKSLFDEPQSGGSKRVDKYGRKVSKNKDRENLRRFYRLGDEDKEEGSSTGARPDYARGEGLMESSSEDEEEDNADDVSDEETVVTLGRDASKPTGRNDEAEIDLDEDTIAQLDAQAANYAKAHVADDSAKSGITPTSRIAVVNLDWDHVRASHLYKIFSSVDKIRSFGKKRMEQEEREGPPPEVFGSSGRQRRELEPEEINEKNIFELNDGDEYNQDALRNYQLERLRYYYAIVTCLSVQTAEHIFSELDGSELERSANVLDLSYVPEDMDFSDEHRDEAIEEQSDFKAVEFATDALRHSKVRLTWDNDDPERLKVTRRIMSKKDLDEIDFKAYIASDSEDSAADDDEERRKRMRAMLLREGSDGEQNGEDDDDQLPEGWGGGKHDKAGELEITFLPGLSDKNGAADGDETTLDKYKRKQKEKKASRKAAFKSKPADGEDGLAGDAFFGGNSDGDQDPQEKPRKAATKEELSSIIAETGNDEDLDHFDMRAVIRADKAERGALKGKRKLKRKLAREQDTAGAGFVLDVADKRFNALHENPSFAIDPSNPKFKRTKGMEALLEERSKRAQSNKADESVGSLDNLVASVKRKSKAVLEQRDRKKRRF